ncbi:porin OmpA [Lonepinella sp. BR2357]|uniref:porin OmpA n=1 Tax=Lonepinella sp. BR2357 TaxID=3434549 RepID=UPI003F6DF9EB
MKKTAIALAIAGLAAASVAQAAPQQNTFYAGAKAGWASFHDGYTQYEGTDTDAKGTQKNSVTYGVFGGYQILNQDNLGLAVELGYDDFGRAKLRTAGETTAKHTNHGAHLTLKPSVDLGIVTPALAGLDFYGKVGAALVRSDYKVSEGANGFNASNTREHSLKTSLVLGAGVEYAITPELAARVEYTWLNNVGKLENADGSRHDYTPEIHAVTAGLSYRFGQGMAPMAAPEVVNKTFTLSSDVTFAFGKSTLKPEASATLDGIYGEIAQVANPAVQVNGYADRIGKDASNLKLSQRRAETVANYLVSKGVDAGSVTATGYGEANPVTGNTCDAVKGRKALIACLAPDRRVDVQVQGNKQVTM